MSLIGMMRDGIRVAAWLTPHIQEWNKNRHKNRRDADAHRQAGNYGEAEKSLQLLLDEARHRKQAGSKIGSIHLELAAVQVELGKLDAAEENVRNAQAALGVVTTPGLALMARICRHRDRHPEAQELIRQAIKREEAPVKPELSMLGHLYQELSESLILTGDLEEAERSQTKALALFEQAAGAPPVRIANARWLLGDIYRRQNKFQLAIVCFEQALELYRKNEPSDSPLITKGLNSVAETAIEMGDVERATAEYERTLVLMDRQLGTKPDDRAVVMLNLGRLYEGSGQLAKAQETAHQAIALNERKRGPQLGHALELMGRLLLRTGRYGDALARFERAQAVWAECGDAFAEQMAANQHQQEAIQTQLAALEEARRSSFNSDSASA